MYKIDFYKDEDGKSELLDFIRELLLSSATNKDARIQYDKIYSQIGLLRERGTALPAKYTKHIEGDIWELRPGKNRILYFCVVGDGFVLLHHFRKTTEKTPRSEIEKAKRERDDYLRRYESHEN
ncbi:MAG: type II toxin-antitoxin system RelE/ParE family toxin [Synergistaceae bacterium]|nr:type II toxin-antitoxin system RelE/ParE family toxin [Synergistaceae bacterium]